VTGQNAACTVYRLILKCSKHPFPAGYLAAGTYLNVPGGGLT
jgi:hypothetical protein